MNDNIKYINIEDEELINQVKNGDKNALEYLKSLKCKKAVIITGGQSMKKTGVLDKVTNILNQAGADVAIYSGIGKNPTTHMVLGLSVSRRWWFIYRCCKGYAYIL